MNHRSLVAKKPPVSGIIPTQNRATSLRGAWGSASTPEGVRERFDVEITLVEDAPTDSAPNHNKTIGSASSVYLTYMKVRGIGSAERGARGDRNILGGAAT